MITTNLAMVVLAMIAAGGIAYVFIYPFLSGERKAEKRQKAIVGVARESTGRTAERTSASRREAVIQSLKEIEQREKARHKVPLETRIAQAGLSWNKRRFYIISVVLSLLTGLVTLVLTGNLLIALGGLFVGGLGLPRWLLGYLRKRRIQKFLLEFPTAIDIIVRGVKSGLPLGDCLRIISTEAAEPVKSEFRYLVEQQALGISMGDACAKLFQRIPIPEANFFGIVVAIQQKTGGSLSDAFGNLSRVLRERKKMKDKINAMSMEAKSSAAIIGALPFIVATLLYVLSPKYIMVLFTSDVGKIALVASAVWMVLGILVMRKMIQFDI